MPLRRDGSGADEWWGRLRRPGPSSPFPSQHPIVGGTSQALGIPITLLLCYNSLNYTNNLFKVRENVQRKCNGMNQHTPTHFFISYNKADRTWAEWIAWHLEEAGYTTIIQAWDFRPGMNFVQKMQEAVQQAERTIAVLSTNYLEALYTYPEWEAAFR